MKKFLRTLFIILIILGLWVFLLNKNPQRSISQKILPLIGMESTTTWNTVTVLDSASVFCEQNSGTIEIITGSSWEQSTLCHLPDGTICDERAYLSGTCPVLVATGDTIDTGNLSGNTQDTSAIVKPYYLQTWANCGRADSGWRPNDAYFTAAKFVNKNLQAVRVSWQNLTVPKINELSGAMRDPSIDNATKCEYSRAIDALQHQPGYIRNYTISGWVITISIDFITYKEASKEIDFSPPFRFYQTKNIAKKVRTYTLASNPNLQTLVRDDQWYVQWVFPDIKKTYLNDFNQRLNDFCHNEKIYVRDIWTGTDFNANKFYCVGNNLKDDSKYLSQGAGFWFDASWNIMQIDLNRRWLTLAG